MLHYLTCLLLSLPGPLAFSPNATRAPSVLRLATEKPITLRKLEQDSALARQTLVLNIADKGGDPVRVSVTPKHSDMGFPNQWPLRATVILMPHPKDSWDSPLSKLRVTGRVLSTGKVSFEVLADRDYVLLVLRKNTPAYLRVIHPEQDLKQSELSLRLPAPTSMGSISIAIAGPSGGSYTDDYALRILDRKSGVILLGTGKRAGEFDFDWNADSWLEGLSLPAGQYDLLLGSKTRFLNFDMPIRIQQRPYGDSIIPFEVQAGGETKIKAQFKTPAHVRLSLKGIANDADLQGVKLLLRDERELHPLEDPKLRAQHATLRLISERGHINPLHFKVPLPQSKIVFHGPLAALGSKSKSEAISPGPYTLEARLPGGRITSRQIVLVAGKTLDVSLSL